MSNLKKNYLYNVIYRLFSMVIPLLVSPYISRVLGAEALGNYSYMNAIVSYFGMLAALGISDYGSRTIAAVGSENIKRSSTFFEIFIAHVMTSIFALVLYGIYVVCFSQEKMLSLILGITIIGNLLDISWMFSGMENFKILAKRGIIIKVLSCIFILLFVKRSEDIYIYAIISGIISVGSSISLWIPLVRYIEFVPVNMRAVLNHIKPMCLLAVPLFITNIYVTSDKLILGWLLPGKNEVAYYENAEKMLIVRNLIYAIGAIMLPRISGLYANGKMDKVKEYIERSYEISMIICYACSFGLIAVANEFASWFWGEEFQKCGELIVIVAILMLFNTVTNTIRQQFLIPLKRDKAYISATVIGAVTNVLLDFLLIPFWKSTGAMLATLISSACVTVFLAYAVRTELPFVTWTKRTWYYFVLGSVMLVVCKWIGSRIANVSISLLVQVIVGCCIYCGGCLAYWKITNKRYYLNLILSVKKRG